MRTLRIVAYKISKLESRPVSCFFVIEPEVWHDQLPTEIVRSFGLWDWVRVVETQRLDRLDEKFDEWLAQETGPDDLKVVAVVGKLTADAKAVVAAAEAASCTVVDTSYPPTDLDLAFLQEVAFHDIEIGGHNDIDGTPTRYGHSALQKMSSTNARRVFPSSVIGDLRKIFGSSAPFEVLDVGCGILSTLRFGVLEGWLVLTGVDPLLEMYEMVLARHGLDALPAILPTHRYSTTVEQFETDKRYHMVYSNNALDHTQDCAASIRKVTELLKPDGLALIQGATHEGTRQKWRQLHKFDIGLDDDKVYARSEDGSESILMGPGAELELLRVAHYSENHYSFIGKKA